MPSFEYKTSQGTFVIDSDRQLNSQEVEQVIGNQPKGRETRNPFLAGIKSASDIIGGPFSTQYYVQRAKGLSHGAAMKRAGDIVKPIEETKIKGVPAQIAYGAVQAAPLIAGVATPFMGAAGATTGLASKIPIAGKILGSGTARSALGFGGYEAAKGLATGQISTPQQLGEAAKSGAISGALFHGGGRLGATAAQPLRGLTKHAARIGSTGGAGGVAALTAPKGEKVSAGIIGGAFGAKYPSRPLGFTPSVQLRQQATNIYKNILKPSKGEIKKIEIRQRGKIDKYYKLAADEGLTIYRDSQNKIDTLESRNSLKNKITTSNATLSEILKGDKSSRFNLARIGRKAKLEAQKTIKNAKDLEAAKNEIDGEIGAEIKRHGSIEVNAQQLNNIKQGMWSKSFKPLEPSSKANARRIGSEIKNVIESAYPNKNIKDINRRTGDLLTLNTLLENSHGRVVSGGRMGGYFARTIGGIAGATVGKVPLVGPFTVLGGAALGEQISKRANDPRLQSVRAQELIRRANRQDRPGVIERLLKGRQPITPEILPEAEIKIPSQLFLKYKRMLALPNLPRHTNIRDVNTIRLRNANTGETIIIPAKTAKMLGFDPTAGQRPPVIGAQYGPKGRFGSPQFTVRNP